METVNTIIDLSFTIYQTVVDAAKLYNTFARDSGMILFASAGPAMLESILSFVQTRSILSMGLIRFVFCSLWPFSDFKRIDWWQILF